MGAEKEAGNGPGWGQDANTKLLGRRWTYNKVLVGEHDR